MSCWTLTSPPVQSPCTSTCCVTRTVKQTDAIRVRRLLQRSCTSRATPLPSMFVCWKNVGSSLRSTPASSCGTGASKTEVCSTRSCRSSFPLTCFISGRWMLWTAQPSGASEQRRARCVSPFRRLSAFSNVPSTHTKITKYTHPGLCAHRGSEPRKTVQG